MKMSYDRLLYEEALVLANVTARHQDWFDIFRDVEDVLFLLPDLKGNTEPTDSPRGEFQWYAFHGYIQAPLIARAVLSLCQTGHYESSFCVLRSLVESFVQLRYFNQHPELLSKQVNARRSQDRVTMKKMMEELSPGFHDQYYDFFSGLSHSKIPAWLHIDQSTPGNPVLVGVEYNVKWATSCLNAMIPVLLGYLKFFPIFFPHSSLSLDTPTFAKYNHVLDSLLEDIQRHKQAFPKSFEWYAKVEPLVLP